MIKKIIAIFSLLWLALLIAPVSFAKFNSFVSVVNPVRGLDFWEGEAVEAAVLGQMEILNKQNLTATFLLRPDALSQDKIIQALKNDQNFEKGLFLEVIPSWTKKNGVLYRQSDSWHKAESAFLSGYDQDERLRLIDSAFEQFKETFGFYPKSVGAWWIDSYSLEYMQKKYGVVAALIVADQYSTDNYQIWGQYWGTPYYPSKKNLLHPAQTLENKLPVVALQWATRDPVNAYGNGVGESTYSVQANDYIDYHNLDTGYFSSLVDIYTKQPLNQFGFLTVGLENSYSWEKYGNEYQNQMNVLVEKRNSGQFSIVTMERFALWYKERFPNLSPAQIVLADDPLGSSKKAVWFMNPYYRAGWFFNQDASFIRDLRQYIDGEEELCRNLSCDEVNFATFATRVLDEVTFGQKWVIDEGKISDFTVTKQGEHFVLSYKNEASNQRKIEFLLRDISVDGKISSIDGAILEATKHQQNQQKAQLEIAKGPFSWSFQNVIFKTFKFLIFLGIGCLIPGFFITQKIFSKEINLLQKIFLAFNLGFVFVTLLFYLLSLINLRQGIFVYLLINFFLALKKRKIFPKILPKFDILPVCLILVGTIFQQLPTFKNGLLFPYGLGFWGPNTHDGVWHISLINQLTKSVPPQNPIFGGEVLKNYHFFYDLLVAATNYASDIPVLDLVFRFYPAIFSILLGIGTYCLIKYFFKVKELLATLFSLYLVYFAGSFGWIVEFIKFKHLGGESAFWANQSISFNLNPPFAISLIFVSSILLLLPNLKSFRSAVAIAAMAGSLIAFKAYGAILILASLILVGIFKRNKYYLLAFIFSFFLSSLLFLANFSMGQKLMIFSPFWFIHSMIDSPDRVGWVRLSLARTVGLEQGNWFKFQVAEATSFLIFLVGNLGTRVFALLYLLKIKNIVRRTDYLFMFIFSSAAFIIPVLFIQAGNPWNTIQFIYYFLYVASLVGGVAFAKIASVNKILGLPLVLIFLLITPINSWATANGYLIYQPHAFIANQEVEALNFLKSQKEGIVLTYPYDEKLKVNILEPWPLYAYDSTAYVAALSGKQVFVEDEPQNQILLTDYKKRLVVAKDFFQRPLERKKFFKDNNIRYIYLPKIFKVTLEPDKLDIRQIYENSEVLIYEVK